MQIKNIEKKKEKKKFILLGFDRKKNIYNRDIKKIKI